VNPERILIVRLGAIGDIVHALPAVSALRAAFPSARIDWLVGARYRETLELVPIVDHCIVLGQAIHEGPHGRPVESGPHPGWRGFATTAARLRRERYDIAFDFQGLIKSASLARLSGAARVVGFTREHLREPLGVFFYGERYAPGAAVHVAQQNTALLRAAGINEAPLVFPLEVPRSTTSAEIRRLLELGAGDRFALINPGGAWPNKRWPAERFGAVASRLASRHGLRSAVLWGPGEEGLARQVVDSSHHAARVAPATEIGDVVAASKAASLMISGDTGPLHLAAAVGTPIVGVYGPTSPARNGPWSAADVCVSRFESCACHHKRRCRRADWCLLDIGIDEVADAVDRRLAASPAHA
jgi:lipopolysaccharide heptosyltransferase I